MVPSWDSRTYLVGSHEWETCTLKCVLPSPPLSSPVLAQV